MTNLVTFWLCASHAIMPAHQFIFPVNMDIIDYIIQLLTSPVQWC